MKLFSSCLIVGYLSLSQAFHSDNKYGFGDPVLTQYDASPIEPRANGGPLRNVYAVADIAYSSRAISPKTGRTLLYGHAFLHVDGTPNDGAIRIEHVQPRPFSIGLRLLDYTVANNDKKTLNEKNTKSTARRIWLVGQTTMTNAEFADPATGKGMILDVWSQNPKWVQGSNCCNQFVENLVEKLQLKVPKQFSNYVSMAKAYAAIKLLPMEREDLPLYLDTVTEWGGDGGNTQVEFDTTDLKNPKVIAAKAPVDESGYLADTGVPTDEGLKLPIAPPGTVPPPPPSPFTNMDTISDSSSQVALGDDKAAPSDPQAVSDGSRAPGSLTDPVNVDGGAAAVTSVRIGGTVNDVTVILEETAKVAGVVGLAMAPLFVILDFAQGNPVGGAFGAVGLLLGLTALAAEGPVGWVIGGLAALFSILPSFFSKPASDPPQANNATQILQYAFFGDIQHTGNEKCREQNPNCTALYGPGVIGMSLKWDNFDPIAFLLQFNKGYAMTLPEIASAFYITDPTKPGDGTDKIATISCAPKRSVCNRFNCPGPNKSLCGTATFKLNKQLITIPVLNETADKIYDRIIPKPHGDCKLINDMSENHYADYNITVTGAPAAIACGITPSLNVSGAVTLINDANANNGLPAAFTSSGNKSTDGSIHEVAAPSPTGFLPNALNATNAVCLSGAGGNMCFPNGTYNIQTGTFGFDSSKVDTLALPNGASVSFTIPAIGKPHQALSLKPWTYNTNQNKASGFGHNFNAIAATAFGPRTFTVGVPDGPPVACLFSQPQYTGDVTCYGTGSGNLSANAVDVAQSLSLHGNAEVWLYGNYYGDDGGAHVTVNTADLTTLPFGVSDNFNKKVKAMWVVG